MGKLDGKVIALTGPRRAEELSKLVEKLGGIPLIRPAQGTVFLENDHVEDEIRRLLKTDVDWFIFTTGMGIDTLIKTAENMELLAAFMGKLKRAKLAARGYKAIGALRRLGLETAARDDDGTTAGLVRVLADHDLKGCRVALQLHGDPAPKLVQYLQEQQTEFREILPYRHVPPEREVLTGLVGEIIRGDIDAVTFTSGPQVRFIFAYAAETGVLTELLAAFEGPAVAVAVGKFTADVVREAGVQRVVFPEEERMGSMILTLAEYYA